MTDFRIFAIRLISLCTIIMLAGCSNPYALNINKLNYDAEQKYGVIQFSDPKLFPREHLIDERRAEITFLENELGICANVNVTPSIIRELEVIRSLSASMGLSFDPAKALNYNASKDIAGLQNEIAQTNLEMQLQQVKRDAQLLKDQLDKQTVAHAPTGANVTSVTTDALKDDMNSLLTKADNILKVIQNNIGANVAALGEKGGKADPIDLFNYKRACRDTVKSEINKTRLDSLHDFEGNALVRLQLKATVLPPGEDYNDTLGILRMEVIKPSFDNDADGTLLAAKVYRNWLEYVNRNINLLPLSKDQPLEKQRIKTSPKFLGLFDYFDMAYLELPKRNSDGINIPKADSCAGLQQKERNTSVCWYLRVALPKGTTAALDVQLQASETLIDQLRGAAVGIRNADDKRGVMLLESGQKCSIKSLDDVDKFPPIRDKNYKSGKKEDEKHDNGKTARQAAYSALEVKNLSSTFASLSMLLQQEFERKQSPWADIAQQVQDFENNALVLFGAADGFIAALKAKNPQCKITELEQPESKAPPKFVEAIKKSTQRVAVYEVAPTERVQAVSTAARAADAVALAASIAGSLPTYGIGASGNVAYSRSAVGKADTLELAPIVVGFAEPGMINENNNQEQLPSFGWLLGPKVVLNAKKQELQFVQPLKPYDLYADLSLPGWWPEFELKTYTAWAPNWRNQANAGKTLDIAGQKTLVRTLKVPMRSNFSDMAGLTSVLLEAANQPLLDAPRIMHVEPSTISPYDKNIDFQILGDNVWRTSVVILGGKLIGNQTNSGNDSATAIRLLPDMHGIVVSLNVQDIPISRGKQMELAIWTPDGYDTAKINLSSTSSCSQSEKPKAPTITEVSTKCVSSEVRLTVNGNNLSDPLEATLSTDQETVKVKAKSVKELLPNDGTNIEVIFDFKVLSAVFKDQTKPIISIKIKDDTVTKSVDLVLPSEEKCK